MARRILLWTAIALAGAAIMTAVACSRDMNRARERLRGRSAVIPSPYGDIDFVESGSGPAVLVIHGSGGGYDQGELLAQAVLDAEVRSIIPSRSGYLRSTFHEGATFDDQAHAYAFLLGHLGVDRVGVVALSHGGPSALLLAVLHPELVSSLTLISAGVARSADDDQAAANRKGDMLTAIFRSDVRYWLVSRLFRKQLMELMGANDSVVASLTPDQRLWVNRIIDYMNPVSQRSAGVALDNSAAMPNERIAAIRAPTLILHATDDGLQLYHNAEYAAARIPGARLVRFDRGGHFLTIVEQDAIRPAIMKHIRENAAGAGTPPDLLAR
jgi:pimeloyl-ACP methyl ester carboxylesterase